jgi:threonine efflux protein
MAIMAVAMSQGRRQAMTLAAGVVCGSLTWGLAAALGLSALMRTYSWTLVALKVFGGLYFLLMSWKAARAAMAPNAPELGTRISASSRWRAFTRGLSMHITNPKAIFVWLSIVALALPSGASTDQAFGVVASCAVIGAAVFFGYAVAFSTAVARAVYSRTHRWFNGILSAVFAIAGAGLLLSSHAA